MMVQIGGRILLRSLFCRSLEKFCISKSDVNLVKK